MSMTVEEKLAIDKFHVDENFAHIIIDNNYPDLNKKQELVKACPAGLYKLNEDQSLIFDYAGCLECGTCRVLALGTIVKEWHHPKGEYGIEFRYG
ncbi:MAG TPA: ferredoxin family protein [Syntrophomonadaceae bacterium]|nr:ferredoxin family protein [Syntrophomonadaceae bacterium]